MFDFFKKNKKVLNIKVEKYAKPEKEKVELESAISDIENGNINSGMDSLIRLALADDPEAEYYLGDINEFKFQNYKEAAKWYLMAAEHGHPDAQRCIADLYIVGKGVLANNKEAIKWYIKAAEQESPEAQFVLGDQYRSGVFVNKDIDIARKYYTLSANNGYKPAKIRLEQLKSKDTNSKSKDNLELIPAQFTTELLKEFVDVATKEGYLQGTSPIVPEIIQWGAHSFLRAIKNTDKISLTDINRHYMYVGMLNFIYASCITQTWNENFSLFKKTDYKINGLEEDFEQALKKMLLTFSKINREIPTSQEFTDFFIKLSEIFNRKMIPYFNVSDKIQKEFIFAGMSSYFTLGMAIKLESIGKCELENSKCDDMSTFHFDNGDKYVGQWKNGLKDGNGTHYYNNGNKYEGQFKDGLMEGEGTFSFASGNKYVGKFKKSLRDGIGTYYYINGDKYEGQFKNGLMDGEGIFNFASGNKYVGQFKMSLRDGIGTYYYINGDKYEGQFKNDPMEGEGILYFANGDKYEGQFKNSLRNGSGTHYYNNGDKYEGQFKNGSMEGEGTYNFASGIKYVGQFKNGLWDGIGTYYFINNDKYEGQFKNNSMEGEGTLYFANGHKYVGQYKNSLFDGIGTCYYNNGDKYVGEYKNGLIEGIGTYYYNGGNKYEGQWKNNAKEGDGTFYYSSGEKYVGQLKKDLMDGFGTLYFPNGTINFEGEWLNGEHADVSKYESQFKNDKSEGTDTLYNSNGSLICESNVINVQVEKYAKLAEELLENTDTDIENLDEIWSLVELFDNGNEKIKKDERAAFSLACFAALKGFGNAQNHVGYCFDNGVIVEEDKVEAFYWFEKAALNNNEFALFNVGDAYFHGYGVDINLELAEKWYKLAAENNLELALEKLEKISINKGNIIESVDSRIDFTELLIQEAQHQGWVAEDKEFKMIPELFSMQTSATEYLLKFMFEQIVEEEEMATTFTFIMTRYLFAKSIEAVIVWGHSEDGKISIYYHTKHLIDKQLEFEIPKAYQKYAVDSLKVGESLFSIYNAYMVNEIKTGKKVELYSSTKELFNWIQKFGIHYALENKYEILWK